MSLITQPTIFEYQTPATLDQAAPVQNTWYTILDTTNNAIINGISVNVEDTDETIEVQLTIDGETLSGSVAATHSTSYYVRHSLNGILRIDGLALGTTDYAQYRPYMIEGKSIKVETRKTTANGAGNLTGVVAYSILKGA